MDPNELTTEIVAGVHVLESQRSGRRFPYEMEDPNVPLHAAEELVYGRTAGGDGSFGGDVTWWSSLGVGAIAQAVSLISGDIAKLPLRVYRKDVDKQGRRIVENHRLNDVLQLRANQTHSAFQAIRNLMFHALLFGNGYLWLDRRGGNVEFVNLLPDRTWTHWIDGEVVYTATTYEDPRFVNLFPEEVVHVKWLQNLDDMGVRGVNPMEVARDMIALAIAQTDFAGKFFGRGGRIGGILEVPSAMTKGARDNLENDFHQKYEAPDTAFKTVVLRDGAKFHQAQRSFEETQMVQSKEQSARDIARLFNLPPSKLGLSDSVSYNSKAEDNRAYLESTLQSWMVQVEQELNWKLLSPYARNNEFIAFDVTDFVRLDKMSEAQVFSVYVQNAILTPNEVRRKLEMPPIEGGDELKELNGQANNPGPEDVDAETPADSNEDNGEEEDRTDFLRALFAMTYRARKASSNARTWATFLGQRSGHESFIDSQTTNGGPLIRFLDHLADMDATRKSLPDEVDVLCDTLERSV